MTDQDRQRDAVGVNCDDSDTAKRRKTVHASDESRVSSPVLARSNDSIIHQRHEQAEGCVSSPAGYTARNHTSNVDDDDTPLRYEGPGSSRTGACRHEPAINRAEHAPRREVEPAARKAESGDLDETFRAQVLGLPTIAMQDMSEQEIEIILTNERTLKVKDCIDHSNADI